MSVDTGNGNGAGMLRRRVLMWGVDHRRAPTAARERVALDADKALRFLEACAEEDLGPAVALSTCNRTEIYVAGHEPAEATGTLTRAFAKVGVDFGLFRGEHGQRLVGTHAVRHLYRVTAGLESLMLGEPQIVGQVKDAYRLASGVRPLGILLERAFQGAFRYTKRVRTETRIGEGAVSVAYAAVELSRKFFSDLGERRGLLVGAGDTGTVAGRHFAEAGIGGLTIVNRSPERAASLVAKLRAEHHAPASARPWEELSAAVGAADVVLCSTSAPEPVLTPAIVSAALKQRGGAPLFILDVAVPRDVHPDVGRMGNVYSYGMEDLDEIVKANVAARRRELPKVEDILDTELKAFRRWAKDLSLRPTVGRFHEFLEEIKTIEMERHRAKMSAETEALVDEALGAFINKIMYRPVNKLRDTDEEMVRLRDLDSLRRLFDLDTAPEE